MTKKPGYRKQGWGKFGRRSPLIFLLSWVLSVGLGLQLAQAITPKSSGTVDPLRPEYEVAQQIYLESCGTCHLAVPPAVLPTQTWYQLLNDVRHYSTELPPIPRFDAQLIARYLRFYSRPYYEGEDLPFQVSSSRFFTALHPQIAFDQPPTLRSCVACHPQAADFDFRSVSDPS
ncbi:cytochrome C [Almyronema epifaneia]|uniref:Cytochrome C n=1 Tax=Almyronema epifaneia S1 TaxID=2991925 RepID=A0ABW6IC62_9CYAN